MAFPNKELGNQLSNTVKINKPGKYYLVIYKTLGEKVDYKFSIEGAILSSSQDDNDTDTNPNKDKLVISEKKIMILLIKLIELVKIKLY